MNDNRSEENRLKGAACNKTPAEFFEKKSTTKNFKTHIGCDSIFSADSKYVIGFD